MDYSTVYAYTDCQFHQVHRIDGKAVWADYLNGIVLTEEETKMFEYLQTCPKKELLEYVGTIFAPIIERRLKE